MTVAATQGARGLTQSKTLRAGRASLCNAPASWTAVVLSSRYAHFCNEFKVPIFNDLWHTLGMQADYSVSIMNEFAQADLGDQRLNQRLLKVAAALARQPQASIPKATGSWGQACAADRFLDHTTFTPHDLLRPHFHRTVARAAAQLTVLAVAATTSLNFGHCPQPRGLGPLNNRAEKVFGLWLHSLLAFTPQGLPLGLLDTQCWARDPATFGGNHQRNRKPVADKESVKWLRSDQALQIHAKAAPATRWVLLTDREGDLYELFALALQPGKSPDLLVRVQHDRGVEKSTRRLFAHLTRTPVAGPGRVAVPRRAGQPARTATLSVRDREVCLRAPTLKADPPPLRRWAIEAREAHPPRGRARLHWRRLTTCAVSPCAQATEIIGWYCVRWGIAVFPKVLKSGCAVAAAQLENAERLQRYLAIKLVVAWQVQALTHLGRVQPEAAAGEILAAAQRQVLRAATATNARTKSPEPELTTVRAVIGRLANLGGHLGRRSDGPPAPYVWRGDGNACTTSLWVGPSPGKGKIVRNEKAAGRD